MPPFLETPKELLYKPNDPKDLRLSSQWGSSKDNGDFHIYGYPDDEGIGLNGGRLGASQAPNQVRYLVSRMTPPEDTALSSIADRGNLSLEMNSLKERHQVAKTAVYNSLCDNKKVISIGGGHDYGYPDGAAFLEYCDKNNLKNPLVINFDAHLDVRPSEDSLSSGTPFYRLLNNFKNFEFLEIGIRPFCNSQEHLKWAKSKGTKVLTLDEIYKSNLIPSTEIINFLSEACLKPRPCFISVDIDAFSSSYAMGCSQSWPSGLTPQDFIPVFHFLLKRLNVLNLGVYEVSPPLDQDNRTSKLAAEIIYQYLYPNA